MNISRSRYHRVDDSCGFVHANVHLHSEVPVLSLIHIFSRNLFDIKIALPFEYFLNNHKDKKIKTLEQIDFYHKRDNKKIKQTINDLEEENNSVHQKLNELRATIPPPA